MCSLCALLGGRVPGGRWLCPDGGSTPALETGPACGLSQGVAVVPVVSLTAVDSGCQNEVWGSLLVH